MGFLTSWTFCPLYPSTSMIWQRKKHVIHADAFLLAILSMEMGHASAAHSPTANDQKMHSEKTCSQRKRMNYAPPWKLWHVTFKLLFLSISLSADRGGSRFFWIHFHIISERWLRRPQAPSQTYMLTPLHVTLVNQVDSMCTALTTQNQIRII